MEIFQFLITRTCQIMQFKNASFQKEGGAEKVLEVDSTGNIE